MTMGTKIAIGGKGGVGKTTVCAVWARLFAEDGCDVLAIDADSNPNLASAFGLPSDRRPKALIEMKDFIAERMGTGKDAFGAYFRLNPEISDIPEQYWVKIDGVKLLVLGAITQAGAGCACSEAAFLRAILSHTILHQSELVLVDLAAGVEHFGRSAVEGIDALVLVVEPGSRSIETARNMAEMARQLGIKKITAVLNKITELSQVKTIEAELQDITILGAVSYKSAVQEADLRHRAVVDVDTKFTAELAEAKRELTKLISH